MDITNAPPMMIAGRTRQLVAVARELEAAGAMVSFLDDTPSKTYLTSRDTSKPSSPTIAIGCYDTCQSTASTTGTETADPDGDPVEIDDLHDGSCIDTSRLGSRTRLSPGRDLYRVTNYVRWLDRIEPEAVVAGDTVAAVAGTVSGTRVYAFTDTGAGLYDAAVGQGYAWLSNRIRRSVAEISLFPTLWPPARSDPPGVTRVPPVALDGPEPDIDSAIDVLLVPSTVSTNFDVLEDRLRKAGYRVTVVDGSDRKQVPTLLPYMRRADRVVCSDHSTVMEAAVAGTPCVIYPFSDEQHGFSQVITETGLDGFQIEHSITHVVRAVDQHLDSPSYRNGAKLAARSILNELR